MKILLSYVRNYFLSINKSVLLITSMLVGTLIALNYTIGIESRISSISTVPIRITAFFLLYTLVFLSAYCIHFARTAYFWPTSKSFYLLALIAALLFAWKIGARDQFDFLVDNSKSPWQKYWQLIIDWPLKALVFLCAIFIVWKWSRQEYPVAGMTTRNLSIKPYILILLCMAPLIAFAATQSDFLHTYPKLKKIYFIYPYVSTKWLWSFLYELSYGSDFFSIELFFRGLLVLGFIKYVGKDAILPMAAFYCSIHFGKPLLECISSYFGGILLGIVVYRTGSIWGGLIAHLGIAWMMELGGYIGHVFMAK